MSNPKNERMTKSFWDAQVLLARRHAKASPEDPNYTVPGYFWPATITRLRRYKRLGGYPRKRFVITTHNRGKVEAGKSEVVIRFFTKDLAGIMYKGRPTVTYPAIVSSHEHQ